METSTLVAVRCRLSKGIFSSERAFEVTMADGTTYSGPVPIHFCWNDTDKPLDKSEAIAREISGWVAGRFVSELEGDQLAVEVPDGEVIAVRRGQIKEPPTPIIPPRAITRS